MRIRDWVALLVCVVAMALAGCNGFFVDQVVTSLALSPQSASLAVGGTTQLHANGVNNDGSTAPVGNVSWTSSNPPVATVSPSGLVTGVSNGTSTITASAGTVSGTATVNVGTSSGALTVTPANQTISAASGSQQFTATLNGQDVTATSQWTSSNPAVAQFNVASPAGLATFLGQGTTTITATNTSNGATVSGSTSLTVGP